MRSVITTINYPTKAVEEVSKRLPLIVVGDRKTPSDWFHKVDSFIGINTIHQFNLIVPENHYARKNLGYLHAICQNPEFIYDTDDDNIPNDSWKERTVEVNAYESLGQGWYNAYCLFSENNIWPRGFSLTRLKNYPSVGPAKHHISSIQQGLSDGEPDVDAIWRLALNNPNKFWINKSIYLKPGAWCPFNSQSTWWFPKAYPLMYLPIHATFRMTDIWRSFVAQRCLWEMGEGVTFHSPSEVYQDRNEHDLLKDFESEIPGYLKNDLIVETLSGLRLGGDVFYNLLTCYKKLIEIKVLPIEELKSVNLWIKDLKAIWKL